ncbi:STAS domain-containing protein [Nonomuraea sp. PA05]|uniref:STAS domain-containing protein n=1 Tax=Nonomuraea sp. PA05 TaxID=2604466 RepID=UPI0011D4F171|nr:STAS domain-containing protein [Nonomuraea sp. PA05]TYB59166.1 STAS domain-containing protein [Nonomuraea sp. PA05]
MSVQERLLYQDQQLTIVMSAAPPGVPAVALIGEIDASNSPVLATTLAGCRQGAYLVVDIGELSFIDVSGLRVLVMPTVPVSQRWIRLHNVTPYQRRLLRMMGWFYQPRDHPAPL